MLEIKVEEKGIFPLLRLAGRFDGFGASVADKEFSRLAAQHAEPFWMLDFAEVEFLSSAGIRSLVVAAKRVKSKGGDLFFFGLNPDVMAVLEMAGLLRIFRAAGGEEEAYEQIQKASGVSPAALWRAPSGLDYLIKDAGAAAQVSHLDIWGEATQAPSADCALISVRLSELGFSFGVGGFGGDRAQAAEALGLMITANCFAGVIPADGNNLPDFIAAKKPDETPLFIISGASLAGAPQKMAELPAQKPTTFEILKNDLRAYCDAVGAANLPLGFILLAEVPEVAGAYYAHSADLKAGRLKSVALPERGVFLIVGTIPESGKTPPDALRAVGAFFKDAAMPDVGDDPAEIALHEFIGEGPEQILYPAEESKILRARIWLYPLQSIRPAAQKRLQIEWVNPPCGADIPDEWDMIIRRLYEGSSRVLLKKLSGGFTATTFSAVSCDAEGRRMLPTVCKIGSLANIGSEENACRNYVQKYILNNGAVILGSASQGRWAGITYNFLGVSGPESRLVWLREHFMSRPIEEFLPLFDRLFTNILKPWYGQPRWEPLRLFAEHTPSAILFPRLLEHAVSEMGVSLDEKNIDFPELKTTLPNPYYVLKHIYPMRAEEQTLWYSGITHGDLNLQNVLLDERENIYVIDFSETALRNIVSDFARLEAIMLIELPRMESGDDLQPLLEYAQGLLRQQSLSDEPAFDYRGGDPMVKKCHAVIRRLRHYADVTTLFETSMIPYWMALLQWTLPVASYIGIHDLRKRLALCISALACRNIL
ncbi:MAG TPA: STAS domain-containing protein [Candidatus Sumerlaeota bacterium]|nr:STAS domain-containing protein [Candidatus Sumerlaeota bacterium]HON49789.1 STAS domain-containing protein [Candidatus Sumerlaeota bacterium]HOR63963.1 STAS domain-containing protein [Candidatus Sumerlaeota bacterium]HPL75111.1 STAS domain-containing protein [Candidatus Sumerlaeota bacterium]